MTTETDLFRAMCREADAYANGESTGDDLRSAVVDYTDAVQTGRRPRLDVVYAPNMRPGDWYAGRVELGGTGMRPVHNIAAARRVCGVEIFTDGNGRRMVRMIGDWPAILRPDPVPVGTQVLVIRGV